MAGWFGPTPQDNALKRLAKEMTARRKSAESTAAPLASGTDAASSSSAPSEGGAAGGSAVENMAFGKATLEKKRKVMEGLKAKAAARMRSCLASFTRRVR